MLMVRKGKRKFDRLPHRPNSESAAKTNRVFFIFLYAAFSSCVAVDLLVSIYHIKLSHSSYRHYSVALNNRAVG